MDEFAKKFYNMGVEEGRKKGRETGIKISIRGVHSAGLTDEFIKQQLRKEYDLTEQEASDYIMEFDKAESSTKEE